MTVSGPVRPSYVSPDQITGKEEGTTRGFTQVLPTPCPCPHRPVPSSCPPSLPSPTLAALLVSLPPTLLLLYAPACCPLSASAALSVCLYMYAISTTLPSLIALPTTRRSGTTTAPTSSTNTVKKDRPAKPNTLRHYQILRVSNTVKSPAKSNTLRHYRIVRVSIFSSVLY